MFTAAVAIHSLTSAKVTSLDWVLNYFRRFLCSSLSLFRELFCIPMTFSVTHILARAHTHSTQARQRRHVTRSFTLKIFFPLSFQLGRDTFWQNGQLVHKSNVLLRRASTAGKSKILYIHWTVHSIHGKCILLDFHHFECNKLPFLVYLAIKASKLAANNLKCILLIRFGPNFIVSPVPGCLTGPRIKTQLI